MHLLNTALLLGAASGFSPAHLGTLLSWTDSDISTRSSGYFDTITDAGSIGGTLDGVTSHKPQDSMHLQGGVRTNLPYFTGTARCEHSAAKSATNFYHDGTQDYHRVIRYYLAVAGGTALQFIAGTYNGATSVSGLGVYLNVSGDLVVTVGKGSGGYAALLTSTTTQTAGWHTAEVWLNGSTLKLSCDNETPVSTTLTSPNAADSYFKAHLGNDSTGSYPLEGFVAEDLTYDAELSTGDRTILRDYLAAKWGGVPGIQLDLDAEFVELTSDRVSTLYDQAVGNDATQTTASYRPDYLETGGPGGAPAVADEPSDGVELTAFLAGAIPQPYTVVTVGTTSASTVDYERIFDSHTSAQVVQEIQGNTHKVWSGAWDGSITKTTETDLIWVATCDGASGEQRVFYDGAAEQSETISTGTSNINGIRRSGSWPSGYSRRIVVNHSPPSALMDSLIDDLASKYSISVI